MGRAMLCKSLIQFSVDGQSCVPSLLFDLTRKKGSVHTLPHSMSPILQQATANPCFHQRLLDNHRQVLASLLCGHCSFLLGPGAHKVLFVPSKSLFPQSHVSSVIKSHWPPKSNSLGVLSPFARCPGWEICCGS